MIAAELAAKGVSRETGQAALAELEPDAQLAAAVRLVRGLGRLGPFHELLQTAGPKLARRGFSTTVIREACRQVLASVAPASG
jgi:SOS response regulatory protein OraA/RecX